MREELEREKDKIMKVRSYIILQNVTCPFIEAYIYLPFKEAENRYNAGQQVSIDEYTQLELELSRARGNIV